MDQLTDDSDLIKERYNRLLLAAIVLGCIVITVYVNLVMGLEVVYTHLFYIPIILAGIWYHRKAVFVALFLGLAHISLGYWLSGHIVPDTFIRASIFVVVALVVGALSENKDRLLNDLRLLLESTDEGIYGVDDRGHCTFINTSARKMLGYSGADILGKDTHDLIHYKRADGTKCKREECCVVRSLVTGTGCRSSDDVFWRKDGTSFPIEFSSYPIIEDGKVKGAVVLFIDITRRKRVEAEIRDARRQAELYVDLMAHDINNMNQIGISYLELGLDDLQLSIDDRIYLQKPLEALKNSSALIETVRKLQRVREGGLKHDKIDMCGILREVVAGHAKVPGRDVDIRLDSPGECYVLADELLRDVFGNIVGNAIKHSTGAVTVDIHVSRVSEDNGAYYRIDISDTGPGIPDELKKKLFHRHQRGDVHITGHGLGLYLVKMLIDGFNGKVWVEDRVPGDRSKGARFVVLLPALPISG